MLIDWRRDESLSSPSNKGTDKIKRGLLLLCATVMLTGCGLFKKKTTPPPPPPEPTRVVIEFDAAGDINPNGEGRASPLGIRIYQLRSYPAFGKANFFALYDNDEEVLGADLLSKQEIMLMPNEKRTVFFETGDNAHTIGLMGMFMVYESIQWKTAAGIRAHKTTVINVTVNSGGITVR